MENITLTQKRTNSPKLFLLFSSIIALLSNVAIIILLGVNGGNAQYYIAPVVLGAMDLLLIASVVFTNYRFKYGLYQSIAYIGAVFITIVVTMVFRYQGNKARIFSLISEIIWIVVHLMTMTAVLFLTFRAAKYRKWAMPAGIASFIAFSAFCVVYVIYIAVAGYFGQGAVGELRPLLYEYNKSSQTYTVAGIGEGKGDTIIIPETFDSIKIANIDCNVFTESNVKNVYLECGKSTKFTNVTALSKLNENTKVHIPKENYDTLRNSLYTQMSALGKPALVEKVKMLTECMAPSGLDSNEVYISYTYTKEDLENVAEDYLPTQYVKKGTVFTAAAYAEKIPYAAHMDETSDEDLHWSYNNLQQAIFTGFYNGETNMEGVKVENNIQNVSLKFEQIYCVSIADDNDTKYEPSNSFKNTEVDGEVLNYRYMTQNTANDILNSIERRDGFDLQWTYGVVETAFDDLKVLLTETLPNAKTEIVQIQPEWSLHLPTITELKTNCDENKVTYGEDLKFTATAQAPAEGFLLNYQWIKDYSIEQDGGMEYEIPCIDINQDGIYTVSVTASAEFTSLTSKATQSINVEVEKRAMPFEWILPTNQVYEAAYKTISATYDETEVVKNDVIDYVIENDRIRNAGTYPLSIVLMGDTAMRYYVPEECATNSFRIDPYQIEANWETSSFNFIYDGTDHLPFVNGTYGIGEDEYYGPIYITVVGKAKNAGTYTATATSEDPNYTLTNGTQDFTIQQREISFVWDAITELTYNGAEQMVSVVALENIVWGEEQETLNKLIYAPEGKGTNVGAYTMNASFPEGSNYKYAATETGNHDYQIVKAPLSVVLEAHAKTYDGQVFAYSGYSYIVNGLQGKDKFEEVFANFAYVGDAIAAINHGDYTIEANYEQGEKYGNYNINGGTYVIDTTMLTIERRPVTLTWQDSLSLVYNAEEQEVKVKAINNVVASEADAQLAALIYADNTATVVGHYVASVALPEGSNYVFDTAQYENGQMGFDITKKALTMTLTAASKVYDANVYTYEDFAYVCTGLEGEDTFESVFADFEFTGDAITAVNAGQYTLSAFYNQGEKFDNYNLNNNAPYGIATTTLTIAKRAILLTWQDTLSFVYNATSQSIAVVSVNAASGDEGAVAGEEDTILSSLIYSGAQTNAGKYTMTASLPSETNYQFKTTTTNKQDYEITKKALTITVTAGEDKIYDGEYYEDYNYAVDGLEGSDIITEVTKNIACVVSVKGTTAAVTPKDVAEYQVRVGYSQGNKFNNYDLTTTTDEFTITHREISLIWTSNLSLEYTATAQSVKVEGFDNVVSADTSKILASLIYTGAQTNVGSYTMKASLPANSNYVFTAGETGECAYEITAKALTVTVDNKTATYDGAVYNDGYTIKSNGLAGSDKITDVFVAEYTGTSQTARNVGDYTISATNKGGSKTGNYTITVVDGTLTITKRNATVSVNNKTLTYDGKVKTGFAISISGRATGDDIADVITDVTYTGEGTTAKNAGNYDVEVNTYTQGGEFANYNLTFQKGTLTISKREITTTWTTNVDDTTYNGQVISISITAVNNAVSGEDAALIASISYANNAYTNAGSYTATATLPSDSNYTFATNASSTAWRIAQKALTVTTSAAADTHTYDGAAYNNFNHTVKGLASTDTEAEVLKNITYVTYKNNQVATAKDVGTYEVRVTYTDGTKYSNYTITWSYDTFEITQREVTLSWPTTKSYDQKVITKAAVENATATGVVSGDDLGISYSGYSNAEGTHTITATISNGNYKIKNGTATFTYTVTVEKVEEKE